MLVITVNGEECLMTKMQEVSLNYHFSVEQRVGSAAYGFFGFNGKQQFKNGSTCTTCTAIDLFAKKNSLLEIGFFLHLHCIVMGLHWLKLPQYLHILFFYWKLVFVHYYGLQSSKNFTKSQG
jgi:hypothetical protein